jgi:hypothetical protein
MASLTNSLGIIDDIESSSRFLSELGKDVLIPSAQAFRQTIREAAAAKNFTIANHSKYSDWVDDLADSRCMWLILDPLIDIESLAPYAVAARVSRVVIEGGWQVEAANPAAIEEVARGKSVGVIDDATASGATIAFLGDLVQRAGGTLAHMAFCCATAQARSGLMEKFPSTQWHQFVEGGQVVVHMRDAFPYWPFSGRASAAHPPIQTAAGPVHIRFPSLTRKSGPWAILFEDYRVLAAFAYARSEATARFSKALGRDATVADLPLLGTHVSLPAYPRHQVAADTLLSSIN